MKTFEKQTCEDSNTCDRVYSAVPNIPSSSTASSAGGSASVAKFVSLADRKAHQEALVCSFTAEHSLPLSIGPNLIPKEPFSMQKAFVENFPDFFPMVGSIPDRGIGDDDVENGRSREIEAGKINCQRSIHVQTLESN